MPPKFSEEPYWTARFADPTPFDWLRPAPALIPSVRAALTRTPTPRILHFGPGTSTLSLELRRLAPDAPGAILNADFSAPAVAAGIAAEQAAFGGAGMQWRRLDLLRASDVRTAGREGPFGVVVDKSSADAVACGEDVVVAAGAFECAGALGVGVPAREARVHPVRALALHFAVLAAPGAEWVCLSYSGERFFFLESGAGVEDDGLGRVLDPADYWVLQSKTAVEDEDDTRGDGDVVHRPKLSHWLYVLRRTDNGIRFRSTFHP